MTSADPIRHVVLLMMENHSFDQMVGCLQQVKPDLDGVPPDAAPRRQNLDPGGKAFDQQPTRESQMDLDPKHETRNVLAQLAGGNAGFVRDFATEHPASGDVDRQNIMGYYPLWFLPALHTLGANFTVCDRWFSSLPGPTWPNRFFALTGTARGRVLMPEGWRHPALGTALFHEDQDTIFDRLSEKGKTWRVYFYDFPSSLLLVHQRRPENVIHYRPIGQFFDHVRREESFPDFTFIEPKYFGSDQNDDHPPHNVFKAEKLIADVYNAIRSAPDLWSSTLLVVAYDEHGGFYDHVTPPAAVPPDDHREEYSFDQYGVRVPALLVSPWVANGVDHTLYDHTSLLKYLIDKWDLGPLGERTARANSIAGAIQPTARPRTVPNIRVPYTDLMPKKPELEKEDSSNHHTALHAFAEELARELPAERLKGLLPIEEAGWLAMLKSWVGKLFLGLGARLTADLEQVNARRVKRTTDVALHALGGAGTEEPPRPRALG